MQPVIDPVLNKYKREHTKDTAVVDIEIDDYDTDTEDHSAPPVVTTTAVMRKDVCISSEQWSATIELESFLEQPLAIKEVVEHTRWVTGAQAMQMAYDLAESMGPECDLDVLLLPVSASLKHRARQTGVIKGSEFGPIVQAARLEGINTSRSKNAFSLRCLRKAALCSCTCPRRCR